MKDKEEDKKEDVARQQLELLFQYGDVKGYSFEVMDRLRQLLLDINIHIEEFYENNLFKYRFRNRDILLVNWHLAGIQLIFCREPGPEEAAITLEYAIGEQPDWQLIDDKIRTAIVGLKNG